RLQALEPFPEFRFPLSVVCSLFSASASASGLPPVSADSTRPHGDLARPGETWHHPRVSRCRCTSAASRRGPRISASLLDPPRPPPAPSRPPPLPRPAPRACQPRPPAPPRSPPSTPPPPRPRSSPPPPSPPTSPRRGPSTSMSPTSPRRPQRPSRPHRPHGPL